MANMQAAESITLPVASATVISKYHFVSVDASGNAVHPGAGGAGGDVIGVAMEGSANGETFAIPVAILNGGIIKVTTGAALAGAARVQTNAAGEAITASSSNVVLGIAMKAATDGEVVSIRAGSNGRNS